MYYIKVYCCERRWVGFAAYLRFWVLPTPKICYLITFTESYSGFSLPQIYMRSNYCYNIYVFHYLKSNPPPEQKLLLHIFYTYIFIYMHIMLFKALKLKIIIKTLQYYYRVHDIAWHSIWAITLFCFDNFST